MARLPLLPVTDCHVDSLVRFGSRPTRMDLLVVSEICAHGDVREAAECLGIAYQNAKNHCCSVYKRLGAISLPHALTLLGWIDIPAPYRRVHRAQ
jgi:hypothetical protein